MKVMVPIANTDRQEPHTAVVLLPSPWRAGEMPRQAEFVIGENR